MSDKTLSSRDRVLLVSMPWGATREPCLGLSILKSVLLQHGVGCDVVHAPMQLLRYLKAETNDLVASTWAASDFVFTREFEDGVTPEQLEVLRKLTQDSQDCLAAFPRTMQNPEPFVSKVLRLRQEIIPRFLDDLMAEIDYSRYSLIGFTCLFDQTIASLALARRIRRRYPEIMLAFGGYALQAPVGPALQKCFSEMDVVAYGDGEPVIVPLWEASRGLRELASVPNITYRASGGEIVKSERSVRIDLDESPAPDYDDFFVQREKLKREHGIGFVSGEMHAESSRGCWYGQKAHCTFCGIDDETLRYRIKSPHVLISQLDQLHRRYNVSTFRFSDYIMPLKYYQDFLPEMARRGAPYRLHYETKANLKRDQIELCARAGIRYLQPGIESFSTPVLKLMCKGVTAGQNVFALCTMLRNGIHPYYNLIFGFPFEAPADYAEMIRILPALYHLVPPATTVPVLVTRYAPLAADPERFGSKGPLKAHWRYDLIFSRGFRDAHALSMDDYCYYYDTPYRQFSADLKVVHSVLQHQVARWKDRYASGKSRLTYRADGDGLIAEDTRWSDEPKVYRLTALHRQVGDLAQAGPLTVPRLLESARSAGINDCEAQQALDDLVEARIVIRIETQLVWLALPVGAFERTYHGLGRENTEVRSPDHWPSPDPLSMPNRNRERNVGERQPFVVLSN